MFFVVAFQQRFPMNFLNENHIAGERNEDVDKAELGFALIMSEMNSPLNSTEEVMGLHIAKLQFSRNLAMKYAS